MRRPNPLLILLLPALNLFAQEAKKPMVAVLPFTSRVLDSSAIDGLVSAMGSELINTGAFRVMERSQMEGILKEQGFQQSGACDGQECAVEVGKLLSVDQMVLGNIAKVGSTYTLTARLVSVQTGEVLKSVTRNSRADVDAILTDILPKVATVLAGASNAEPVALPSTTPVTAPVVVKAPVVAPVSMPLAASPVQPSSTPAALEETPRVEEQKHESHWGWWLAGGALVAGGATTAVLLMSGNSSSSPSTTTVHASW